MKPLMVPPLLDRVLARSDAALFISISGGKDSQAMLASVVQAHRDRAWSCGLFAIHADLGRTEWKQSLPHCQKLCDELGIFLKVVRRPQGDLLQEIQDRQAKLTGTGRSAWPSATQRYCTADQKRGQIQKAKRQVFWPDAANRYCTADQKRGQIDKALRAPHWPSAANRYCTSHQKADQIDKELRGYNLVVSAMGMRGQESKPRAKKPALSLDCTLTAKMFRGLSIADVLDAYDRERRLRPAFGVQRRLAFDWLPIHGWSIDDVWEACGTNAVDVARRQQLYATGADEDSRTGRR
jgi:3'-phosphoadenosine 5'-phosphosulfate sulfotransferase (PAPS reductase)/FAD synthetase